MAIDIKDEFDEKAAEQLQEEMEQNEIQPDADTVETQDGEDPIAGDTEETGEEEESKEDDKAAKKSKKSRFKADKKQDALNEKIAELEDKVKRQMAEFDNFRKRTIKEKAVMYDDGVRSTIEKLLTVIDNLERAVAVQEGKVDADDAFFKGVKMTLVQFREILHSMGVEEIKALGEKFDPNLHAAVAHEDDESYGENEVILEMLKGYKYKDKVIRHSMVKVAN